MKTEFCRQNHTEHKGPSGPFFAWRPPGSACEDKIKKRCENADTDTVRSWTEQFRNLRRLEDEQMKAEILAPAGSRQSFDAAWAAGADAVYLGLPKFGARAFADNFGFEEMKEIIEKAHLGGMKVYITMNTLLEENEVKEAAKMAGQITEMGADALIVQDLGLIHYLHQTMPEIELHASTQLSVLKPEQIEKLKMLGISRVVLAREATLDEIRACARTGMELEVFVHGALCISFSGQCQFSRIRYGRSGNKGACAQPCRMEYTLLENGRKIPAEGNYLLSPKDLSVLGQIPQLEQAGVSSLKIEGRMKSPVYVFESVLKARKAQNREPLSDQDIRDLTLAYSRGFTKGHAFLQTGPQLMNPHSGAHQGVEIGRVTAVSPQRIRIQLSEPLFQNDGIRFVNERSSAGGRVNFLYSKNGKLISSAAAGQTVEIPAIRGVYPQARVFRTVDSQLEKEVQREIAQRKRQIPVDFELIAEGEDKPVLLRAYALDYEAQIERRIAERPLHRATEEADFIKQLSKTGNTFAKARQIHVNLLDQVFVPLREINRLRDDVLDLLKEQILAPKPLEKKPYTYSPVRGDSLPDLLEVQKPDQIVLTEDQNLQVISQFPFSHTARKASISESEGLVSAHLGNAPIVDGMNVTNSYAIAALLQMGYHGAVLSPELSDEGRKQMMEAFRNRYGFDAPVILPVYGANRLMLMQHCPVNTTLKDGKRKNCSLCRTERFELLGKDGRKAWLYGDPDCRMQIFDETELDRIDEIPEFEKEGIHAFSLSFSDEDSAEARSVIERFEKERLKAESGTVQ